MNAQSLELVRSNWRILVAMILPWMVDAQRGRLLQHSMCHKPGQKEGTLPFRESQTPHIEHTKHDKEAPTPTLFRITTGDEQVNNAVNHSSRWEPSCGDVTTITNIHRQEIRQLPSQRIHHGLETSVCLSVCLVRLKRWESVWDRVRHTHTHAHASVSSPAVRLSDRGGEWMATTRYWSDHLYLRRHQSWVIFQLLAPSLPPMPLGSSPRPARWNRNCRLA